MKIVITDPSLTAHSSAFEMGVDPGTVFSWHRSWDDPSVLPVLRDADVFVGARLTKDMAAAATSIRLIHTAGAGFDGIDPDALGVGAVCVRTPFTTRDPSPNTWLESS